MDQYYKKLDTHEDLEIHKSVVLDAIDQKDKSLVEKAIKIVVEYHNTPRTMYEGTYNRHPIRVARILLEEFGVKDTNAILIALCHDLGEWSDYDVDKLEKEFGADIKAGVEALTWSPHETWETFFQSIVSTGDEDLLKVKMADKLDNNRAALFSDDKHKQKAKEKTELIVRPFIEKRFPEYWKKFEESLLFPNSR
jgi:guanosine-3',5'-bis(diphosphate) 3'-pyrophosphohydrolase